jgi:pimeloyl-ACP methyl ester carboxylesterase
VFAIDLNGFGYTQRPRESEAYGLDGQATLVMDALDRLGLKRVDLIGHSFGSVVALRVAEMQPRRVRRLALISPATSIAPMPLLMRFAPARQLMYPVLRLYLSSPRAYQRLLRGAYHQPGMPRLADSEVYRNQLLVQGFNDAYHGFGRAMNSKFTAILPAGEAVKKPILILAGRHDQLVPLPTIQATATRLKHAKMVILEDCGHSAMEEAPDKTARHIHRFLTVEN